MSRPSPIYQQLALFERPRHFEAIVGEVKRRMYEAASRRGWLECRLPPAMSTEQSRRLDFHSPGLMAGLVHPAPRSFRPVVDLEYAEPYADLATEHSVRDPDTWAPRNTFSI